MDAELYALRSARAAADADLNARLAATVAAQEADLAERDEKLCTNTQVCAETMPVTATNCPGCGKYQGQSASGTASGANRTRTITFHPDGGTAS